MKYFVVIIKREKKKNYMTSVFFVISTVLSRLLCTTISQTLSKKNKKIMRTPAEGH